MTHLLLEQPYQPRRRARAGGLVGRRPLNAGSAWERAAAQRLP
ncbi:MAG: hypothetical protein AAFP68_22620 [Pseudomonadota bacterium]